MAKIEEYRFGSIRIDGHVYEADLIIFSDRIQQNWWRKEGHTLQMEDIGEILQGPPEALVIGQGESGRMKIDPRVDEELRKLRIEVFAAPTKAACRKFNELSEQGKRVVAALHLTC